MYVVSNVRRYGTLLKRSAVGVNHSGTLLTRQLTNVTVTLGRSGRRSPFRTKMVTLCQKRPTLRLSRTRYIVIVPLKLVPGEILDDDCARPGGSQPPSRGRSPPVFRPTSSVVLLKVHGCNDKLCDVCGRLSRVMLLTIFRCWLHACR